MLRSEPAPSADKIHLEAQLRYLPNGRHRHKEARAISTSMHIDVDMR